MRVLQGAEGKEINNVVLQIEAGRGAIATSIQMSSTGNLLPQQFDLFVTILYLPFCDFPNPRTSSPTPLHSLVHPQWTTRMTRMGVFI